MRIATDPVAQGDSGYDRLAQHAPALSGAALRLALAILSGRVPSGIGQRKVASLAGIAKSSFTPAVNELRLVGFEAEEWPLGWAENRPTLGRKSTHPGPKIDPPWAENRPTLGLVPVYGSRAHAPARSDRSDDRLEDRSDQESRGVFDSSEVSRVGAALAAWVEKYAPSAELAPRYPDADLSTALLAITGSCEGVLASLDRLRDRPSARPATSWGWFLVVFRQMAHQSRRRPAVADDRQAALPLERQGEGVSFEDYRAAGGKEDFDTWSNGKIEK
jgi:hypothetical protein